MFRYSICDPLKPEPIEMGEVAKEKIMDILNRFPWLGMLERMHSARESEVHYSPSLEFENTVNRHGLSISIIDDKNEPEFLIFYKRPKTIKKLLGLISTYDENYTSDRMEQSMKDVQEAIQALINNDLKTLENRWG